MFAADVVINNEGPPAYALIAPYVLALGSVITAGLTVRQTRKGGHRAWLNDRRVDAYSRLLELTHQFSKDAAHLWPMRQGEGLRPAALKAMQSLLAEIDYAANRVALLGPLAAGEAALAFDAEHGAVVDFILSASDANRDGQLQNASEWTSLSQAYTTFHRAASESIEA